MKVSFSIKPSFIPEKFKNIQNDYANNLNFSQKNICPQTNIPIQDNYTKGNQKDFL